MRFLFALLLSSLFGTSPAFTACLDEAPKPSEFLYRNCDDFSEFGLNRGSYSNLPYEKANDGLGKEHFTPIGPNTDLLDFTRANQGKLRKLVLEQLPKICAPFYEGERFNLKDGQQNTRFLILRNKGNAYQKKLLDEVMRKKKQMTVRELANAAKSFFWEASGHGDKIFMDQLLGHAGSLELDYRKEYLGKLNKVLESLAKGPREYTPSDCDYLNAPINRLYGLIQISRLTAEMVKASCPEEYRSLGLEKEERALDNKIAKEWKAAIRSAVFYEEDFSSAPKNKNQSAE